MRGFALALREDLIGTGVGVSLVYPGFISDAGMFAESGTELPPFVGTKTPEQVAEAVITAIEKDRAEISVAPFDVRAGAAAAGLMPSAWPRSSAASAPRRSPTRCPRASARSASSMKTSARKYGIGPMRSRGTCRKPTDCRGARPARAGGGPEEDRRAAELAGALDRGVDQAAAGALPARLRVDHHLGQLEDAAAGRLERDAADHGAVAVARHQHVAAGVDVVAPGVGERLAVLVLEVNSELIHCSLRRPNAAASSAVRIESIAVTGR